MTLSKMLTKNLFLTSLCLLGTTKGAAASLGSDSEELLLIYEDQCFSNACIDDLLKHIREPIERSHDYKKTYKLIGEAIVDKYNITFEEKDEKFVFRSCIPKTPEQCGIDEIVNKAVERNNCRGRDTPKTFQNYTFHEKIRIFTECVRGSLKLLIDFAAVRLSAFDPTNANASAKICEIAYDPEKNYDANVILAVNWFIKLVNPRYENTFLYNYHISIEEVDECYVFVVTFYNNNSHKDFIYPTYDLQRQLIKYHEIISKLDFKEMSENETANKFCAWAKSNAKPEYARHIYDYVPFYDDFFDIIRKRRSSVKGNFYYHLQDFAVCSNDKYKKNVCYLNIKEDEMLGNLHRVTGSRIIVKPLASVDFLYPLGNLTTEISYKCVLAQEIHLLSLIAKYANLCFVHKRFRKIIELLRKHGKLCKTFEVYPKKDKICKKLNAVFSKKESCLFIPNNEMLPNFLRTERDITNVLDTPFLTDLFTPANQDLGLIPKFIPKNYLFNETSYILSQKRAISNMICTAVCQETKLIGSIEKDGSSDSAKEIKSFTQTEAIIKLFVLSETCECTIKTMTEKYSDYLFNQITDEDRLKLLEKELINHALETGAFLSTYAVGQNDTKEISSLLKKKTELKNEIRAKKLSLYKMREDANKAFCSAWIEIENFLREIKDY